MLKGEKRKRKHELRDIGVILPEVGGHPVGCRIPQMALWSSTTDLSGWPLTQSRAETSVTGAFCAGQPRSFRPPFWKIRHSVYLQI